MPAILKVSRSLPETTLEEWASLVKRASEQQFSNVGTEKKVQGGMEAKDDVYNIGVANSVEQALAQRWIDPLEQHPIGYVLRLEEMRKMESKRTGPWADNAEETSFQQTGGPTSSTPLD